ncbi:hypothetical protein [Saccharopolyspora cebuensis]|uniref:hypothetical protein n=1 Tax=Saccharopolyspora cebuensis TaxID=418759 RepID=UPI0031ED87E2
MSESRRPNPAVIGSPDDRVRYEAALATSRQVLRAVEPDHELYYQRTTTASGPLTVGERVALAQACDRIADACDLAALAWEDYRDDLGLGRAQRDAARRWRQEAELQRAVAVIAPAHERGDPFAA